MTDAGAKAVHSDGPFHWPTTWASLSTERRLALAMLVDGAAATSHLDAETQHIAALDLAQALADDQIDQLFLHAAEAHSLGSQLPPRLVELLRAQRLALAANVVCQEHALEEAGALLDANGVEHVVFKGALTRRLLYPKPHLRPAVDVDLLIAPAAVQPVVRLFGQQGYVSSLAAHADTHEASLLRHGVHLDLHWSLLRPGRMRQDITSEMLTHRVRRGERWSPNDVHLTVAMLVHPAITDHVTGRLITAVDLDRWLRHAQAPWDEVLDVLARIGLRTAAWAMLRWTTSLFATPVPEHVMRALAPSSSRRRYIEAWLARHPAQLYRRRPNLVRAGFSLALQDRASDTLRALWRLARKRRMLLAEQASAHR
jgi:hypothetical protein